MKSQNYSNKKIIFFDGVCNLCNGFIDFTIKRNKNKDIYYCSLQSQKAKEILAHKNIVIKDNEYSTIYFLNGNSLYNKSSAILQVLKNLSKVYMLIGSICLIFPKFIRDYMYTFIAKNRYLFFGKKESCRLPLPEEINQFL